MNTKENININTERIIIIPSIGDPRNTVTSIATFQNAFGIDPPLPIVVVYGSCPDEFRALGENMQPQEEWISPWSTDKIEEYRRRFKQISEQNSIPIYFFDKRTQWEVWGHLISSINNVKKNTLPDAITQDDLRMCIDEIFGATYSYGAQRNKAFIVANNLSSNHVFFFDDDIYFTTTQGNMIERHDFLLKRNNVYAVTGGYIGQRAFNVTIFRRVDEQQEFMGLLGYDIPDDQATADLWGWRIADGVLGGNFCIKREVYENICCPSAHRIPTTDDKLIGREIQRVFNREAHIYKTGWGVIHIHFPGRMEPKEINAYLTSWSKTKAFWSIYFGKENKNLLDLANDESNNLINDAIKTIKNFGERVLELGEREKTIAPSPIADAILNSAGTIIENSASIANTVFQDMKRFEKLKLCWKYILENSKINIWRLDKNCFLPKTVQRA